MNVTSDLARRVQVGVGTYSTAKAGLLHLSKIMDAENKRRGVRVFALQPGVVKSRMTEQLRASGDTPAGAAVAQMLRDIERGPGLVDPTETGRLIRLVATGHADDLAGKAFSIYDPAVRVRIRGA